MKKIYLTLVLLLVVTGARSQNFEYRLKAGFNIGGTSPLPLPNTIRKITGYTPTMTFALGGDVIYNLNDKWGLQSGLKFETKGMTTWARVKGYYITFSAMDETTGRDSQEKLRGYFTGSVKTKVKNEYFTLPILGVYKLSSVWQINLGVFMSVLLRGDFSGYAYNGYLRHIDPTGAKLDINHEEYDFSSDIRKFNWGGQIGASWKAYKSFSLYGDLTFAANSIFKKDFDSIGFDMYNIYLNLGFSYTF